jgi:hypothetical protein
MERFAQIIAQGVAGSPRRPHAGTPATLAPTL